MVRVVGGREVEWVRPATSRRSVLSAFLSIGLVFSLLAAVVIVEPAAAQGPSATATDTAASGTSDTSASTSTPTRSDRPDAPTDVRAVATAVGTEVRWKAPVPTERQLYARI